MTSKLKFSRFLRLFYNAKKGKFFTWKMLYVCLDKNICCPFLVEQNRSRLESVRKSRSPVPLLHGSFWSSRKIHLTDGSDVPLPCPWNIVIRLINSHRSPRRLTKDAARTDIPACFRSSTHAQSQGFPLSRGGKGLQYHLLWSEGGARLEGTLSNVARFRFWWEVRASALAAEGWKPVRLWEEPAALRLRWQLFPIWGFIAQTFHFVPARVCFCNRERANSVAKRRVISRTLRQRGGEQWGWLLPTVASY